MFTIMVQHLPSVCYCFCTWIKSVLLLTE